MVAFGSDPSRLFLPVSFFVVLALAAICHRIIKIQIQLDRLVYVLQTSVMA